jgi:signal transduction histidine kinase
MANRAQSDPPASMRPGELAGTALAGLACLAGLTLLSQYNFLLFHSVAETFSVAIGWAAFGIAWNSRHRLQSGYLLILGTSLLCVGGIDLVHTMAYKGMGVFPENDPNLPTQLWIAGRYLEGVSFVLAALFLRRPARPAPLLGGYLLVTALLLVSVFGGWFPDCYIRGHGLTQFKILSEYAVCILFLLSGVLFYRGRENLDPLLFKLLLTALALSIVQELLFTFYVSVYGLSNLLGHFTKIGVFWLLYYGVVRMGVAEPHRVLFRELEASRSRLAESQQRLQEAQRVAGAGTWEWRAETGEVSWSEQMFRLVGENPETFRPTPKNLRALFGPRAWEAYKRNLLRCLRQDDHCEFEISLRLPGHEELRHLEISCRAMRQPGGELVSVLGMLRDVTRRHRMQAMREDVERILHHDLKSPVASLVGSLQMLNATNNLPSEYRDLLRAMEHSARDVLLLIERSLALRRIEEGSFSPGREPVNMLQLLGEVRRQTSALRRQRKVRLSVHLTGFDENGQRPATPGDAPLLQSMLANLVTNAVEAAPEDSTVTVNMGHGDGLHIAIHNQGAVPEEVRERFFEKYATHGKSGGTGLGTYSARLIAQAHGGEVRMRTSEEHGTTVGVRLPLFQDA